MKPHLLNVNGNSPKGAEASSVTPNYWLVLASLVPKTTLPELFSSIYFPFFSSFLQNEPNSHFT
jgi:hypothetical protein